MSQDDEEVKDDAVDTEEHEHDPDLEDMEIPEGELHEHDDKEIDVVANVASSSFSDDEEVDEEDPYDSFNKSHSSGTKDSSQLDPYGVGAPAGFGGEDEEDFLGDDEEEEEMLEE